MTSQAYEISNYVKSIELLHSIFLSFSVLLYNINSPIFRTVGHREITLANKGKKAQTAVTCFVSTNSTVHVSGLCLSGN